MASWTRRELPTPAEPRAAGCHAAQCRSVAVLLAALLGTACGECPPGAPLNLVLISLDTLRPDVLGAYGYPRETSPHLDRLAREGVLFENATATS